MMDIFKRIMRNMHTHNRLALNMRDVLLELTCRLDSCKDRAASTTPSSARKALVVSITGEISSTSVRIIIDWHVSGFEGYLREIS